MAIGFPLGGMANLVLRSRAHWSELELSPVPKLVLQVGGGGGARPVVLWCRWDCDHMLRTLLAAV